jgi:hypothetical protein
MQTVTIPYSIDNLHNADSWDAKCGPYAAASHPYALH